MVCVALRVKYASTRVGKPATRTRVYSQDTRLSPFSTHPRVAAANYSVHVVQVLAPLAVEDVVVDDLEASEVRAVSTPSDDGTESSQRIRGAVPTRPSRPWASASGSGGALP